nr:hypothetical protein [Tanacetum cinerariifolium]
NTLQFVKEPIEIMGREIKRLKSSQVPLVKVVYVRFRDALSFCDSLKHAPDIHIPLQPILGVLHNQNSQNRRFNRRPNPNLVSKHCNMFGHTIDKCFELVGYPSGLKKNPKGNNSKASVNNVTTSANAHVLTSDDYQELMALLRNSRSGIACHWECYSTYSAYVRWIIDSGASQHMTYSVVLLFNVIDVSHLDITVAHPNGTVAKVNQIGSFKLTKTLIIHDVLAVLGYHDSTQKSLVGTGSMIGHPSGQVLKVLKGKIDLDNLNTGPCDVCHKAKQTRKPFPLSNHKTSKLGDLVHLDVWGPYKIRSREGYRHVEKELPKTKKSSMNTSMVCLIISWKIAIIHRWNVPGALQSLKGMRLYANVPYGQVNVVFSWSFGSTVEDVYMSQPEGYFTPGDQRVCKLKKSLYGLKQAPRKWNEKVSSVLCELGSVKVKIIII